MRGEETTAKPRNEDIYPCEGAHGVAGVHNFEIKITQEGVVA